MEIINNLPLFTSGLFPYQLTSVSPDIQLYLRQVETIKYLAFDVVGFTLAYLAFFIYAIGRVDYVPVFYQILHNAPFLAVLTR